MTVLISVIMVFYSMSVRSLRRARSGSPSWTWMTVTVWWCTPSTIFFRSLLDVRIVGFWFLSNHSLHLLLKLTSPMHIPHLGHRITKVNFNSALIDQYAIHPWIRNYALVFGLELDECILQRVSRLPVPDHLTRYDFSKTREDNLQVFTLSHLIQLAHEKHVFGWLYIRLWKIIQDFKYVLSCLGVSLKFFLFHLSFRFLWTLQVQAIFQENSFLKVDVLQVYIFFELNRTWRPIRVAESYSKLSLLSFKRIINHNRVLDPYVLQGPIFFINVSLVNFIEHIQAFCDFPKNSVLLIKALNRFIR